MPELIDRYATMDAIPAPTDADEAEYYGKVCDAIEAMPTIEADSVNRAAILRLCNEIEDLACDIAKHTMNDIIAADSRMIFDMAKEIGEEITT